MSGSTTKRRDKRFEVRLALTLRQGNRSTDVLTENVSYRGLFVRTDRPPPLRQLVKLDAILPPEGARFASHGMSVFVIEPGHPGGHPPGAGIQFYGMGDERRAWEAFVNHIKPVAEGSVQVPVVTGEALPGPEPIRRRHERVHLVLEVNPRTIEDLLRMWTRDVSAGGMFLSSNQRLEIGTELKLVVKHPRNGQGFPLEAVVRRQSTEAGASGVGVEFVAMSDGRRREFFQFITSSAPSITPEELGMLETD